MTSNAAPHETTLEAGTHWLCTCGRTLNSPHCDGSHQGTTFQPMVLELETPKHIEVTY